MFYWILEHTWGGSTSYPLEDSHWYDISLLLHTLMGVLNSEISRCAWLVTHFTHPTQRNLNITMISPIWSHLMNEKKKFPFYCWQQSYIFTRLCVSAKCYDWILFLFLFFLFLFFFNKFAVNDLRIYLRVPQVLVWFLWHSVVDIPLPGHWQNMYCSNDLANML